jgi:hypothetical protein
MTERQHDLSEWLEAEARDAWDDADASFAAVAALSLPRSEVPTGLSARVMAAIPRTVGYRWARALAGLLASFWVKGTVGAAMVVLGAALATITPGQLWTFGTFFVASLAAAGHGVVVSVSAAFSSGVAAWSVAASLGQAAAVLTTTKTTSLVMVANLALAAGAFAGLTRLLTPGEEDS